MSEAIPALSEAHYPALSSFLSSYLHEDFFLEHRTPDRAMGAFCLTASDGQRRALREECERFLAATKDLAWKDVKHALRGLGSSWAPKSRSALEAVFAGVGAVAPK